MPTGGEEMAKKGPNGATDIEGTPVQRSRDRSVERFNFNLNSEAAAIIREYADRKGISLTEAIRRAIGVLQFVDEMHQKGSSVVVNDGNTLKEVMFLV
jgi:hypothetical protein